MNECPIDNVDVIDLPSTPYNDLLISQALLVEQMEMLKEVNAWQAKRIEELSADAMDMIVCAANRLKWDGHTVVVAGVRHWDDIMNAVVDRFPISEVFECEQGFVDNNGAFLTREEAFVVATRAGQIKHKSGNPNSEVLFSEDLW